MNENVKFLNFGPLNNNSKLGLIAAPVPLVRAAFPSTFIPALPSANCAKNEDNAKFAGSPDCRPPSFIPANKLERSLPNELTPPVISPYPLVFVIPLKA